MATNQTQPKVNEPIEPSNAPPEPVVAQAEAPSQVTLSTEAFNALMKRLGDLEATQGLMLQVEDKDKISKIEALRNSGKLVKSVKIRRYDNKFIIGWKTVEDQVYKDEQGRLVEKQIIEIWYDDNSKSQMSMRQWANAPEYVAFEVTKESKDAEGNLFFVCVGPDGKTIELNANFIN